MVLLKMQFSAESTLDPVPRSFAVSIDKPIPSDFMVSQPELSIGMLYRFGSRALEFEVDEGEHVVYVATDAPDETAWKFSYVIPEIASASGRIWDANPWHQSIEIEPLPPIEIPEEIPEDDRPPIRIEPIEPVTTVTAPVLPWYAAWTQPIIDYFGVIAESVSNFFAPFFSSLQNLDLTVTEAIKTFFSGLGSSLGDLMGIARNTGANMAAQTIKEASEGSPEWKKDLDDTLTPIEQRLVSEYQEALDIKTYEKSPLEGDDAVNALDDMKNKLLATAIVNFAIHAATESGSLGQYEFMKDFDPMVVSKLGMNKIIEEATMKPIEKAILIPAEHEFNKRYHPLIPAYSDLINMRVKEVLDESGFNEVMAKSGYSNAWSKRIWDAHFYPPNYNQLLQSYYRGTIKLDELKALRTVVDLDPKYKTVWDSLIEVIPPYSDLINMLVKEVIDQPTFDKYLQWHGYGKEWSKRIWDAHFIPPSLGDILTAWRRGEITEDRVSELMILVDLDPRYKDIFDTRKYVDPTLREGRYMYELGAIDEDRLSDIVKRRGFTDEDSTVLVKYLTTFQERGFRLRYLTALQTGVIYGAIPEDELTGAVLEAGYSKEVAGWMIKTANVRKRIEEGKAERPRQRILSVAELKKAYVLDKIDDDALRTELMVRGYETGEVDLLIELMNHDKYISKEGRPTVRLTTSQMLNAYRYQEMSRDELTRDLQLRGLSTDEVETLIKTKEKQWGVIEE